ncbi:aldo/keto reductase [Magnetospira thiophila]
MRYRELGRTGLRVSEVGFGTWGIGGRTAGQTSYGATDDRVSLAALDRALELGITFFDTSNLYGAGHSEELLGQAVRGRRDQAVIATKAGWDRYFGAADFSPDAVRASLEGSLRRLGCEYVDLVQLHNPDLETLRSRPEILDGLRDLQREGLIRAWGLSLKSPAEAVVAVRELGAPAVQVNVNMLDLRALDCGLLGLGAGVIARTPLNFGYLTGAVTAETPLPDGDHRAAWPEAQRQAWSTAAAQIFDLLDLRTVAERAEMALRFCVALDGVSCVIPGCLTPDEVTQNARAGTLPRLDHKTLERIIALSRAADPFRGPGQTDGIAAQK